MPNSRATRSPDSLDRLATATSSTPGRFWKPGMCRLRVFLPAPTNPTRIVRSVTGSDGSISSVLRGRDLMHTAPTRPLTGEEFLDSLRGGREIWVYGERVKDVTTHPAFRNPARMLARLYDALHEPATRALLTCATATGSALTHHNVIAHPTTVRIKTKEFAVVFIAAMDTPGVKLICRPAYAMAADVMGSPFDYPLSSRMDENDAILVLDHALVPWENVFVYEDVEKSNMFFPGSGFLPRAMLHGCTRLAVKLDFIAGLVLKAVDAVGSRETRNVQASVGEAIAWRNLFWGLSDAMARAPVRWVGDTVLPNPEYAQAYRVFSTVAYPRVKELIEGILASGLIYMNSHAVDFRTPALRPYP